MARTEKRSDVALAPKKKRAAKATAADRSADRTADSIGEPIVEPAEPAVDDGHGDDDKDDDNGDLDDAGALPPEDDDGASAGMAVAAQRWDPDQGTRFGTYAVYWIRAQLTKFLMTHGRAIHTGNTRAGRKLYFQLPRVRRKLLAEGKEPSVENIAKEVQE